MSPMVVHTLLFALLAILPLVLMALLVAYWRRSRLPLGNILLKAYRP